MAGEQWHFGYEEIEITEKEADKRMAETPTKTKVVSWWYEMTPIQRPRMMTTLEVFEQAFDTERIQSKRR